MCKSLDAGASNRLLPVTEKQLNVCSQNSSTCSPECSFGTPHECNASGIHCACVPVVEVSL